MTEHVGPINQIIDMIAAGRLTAEQGFERISSLQGSKENTQHGLVFFRSDWIAVDPLPKERSQSGVGTIVVFDTEERLWQALNDRLSSVRIVLVQPGAAFTMASPDRFTVRPDRRQDYVSLVDELRARYRFPPVFIQSRSATTGSSEGQETRTLLSALFLSQALMQAKMEQPVRLLHLCWNVEAASALYDSAMAAYARTIRMENPLFQYSVVDLSECGAEPLSPASLTALIDEVVTGPGEAEVKHDLTRRYVRRLQPLSIALPADAATPFRREGVYLITGGAGGIGLQVAQFLQKRTGAKVALIGRRRRLDLDPSVQAQLDSLERQDSGILYLSADIARQQEALQVVESARDRFGRIHGVIHSAGVYRDGFTIKKSPEEVEAVLMPKVAGALNLDRALADEPLDFFAVFSSLASVTGKVGQCDYAYANSFLDHFAAWREGEKAKGKRFGRTVSLNWPLWISTGMQLSDEERSRLATDAGMEPMPVEQGLLAFASALLAETPQVVVTYGDRQKITRFMTEVRSVREPERKTATAVDTEWLTTQTERLLSTILAETTGLSMEQIVPGTRFEQYGIDSIVINHFNAEIEKRFGVLQKTLLFEYHTIRDLTGYVVRNHVDAAVTLFGRGQADQQRESPDATVADTGTEPNTTWRPLQSIAGGPGKRPAPPQVTALREPSQAEASPYPQEEAIAIIGLSGRYPKARNLRQFWENLKNGADCITEIPPDRWDWKAYFDDARMVKEGTMYCKWGGFLDDVDRFDPLFFQISPREAELMDPQERLFLEACSAVLEEAGYTRERLARLARRTSLAAHETSANVGVFVGVTSNTYHLIGAEQWGTGNKVTPTSQPWSIANRVSYLLNCNGPSMAVDTACSSALTAIQLAVESLHRGECEMAIAGGVNLYLHPYKYVSMCQINMLSRKGRCYSFGQDADGIVPGEGVGAVLLKPLSKAVADGDLVYGVIKGIAVNHGGRTSGYSVPNPNAQSSVVLDAIRMAKIDPRTISYIEAHGTGTALGDPIEIAGLTRAFRTMTEEDQFCAVGSIKSNIGHLESAAGLAGLTKVLLQMKYGLLVPTLHAQELNPQVPFDGSPFYLQRELAEWKRPVVTENGVVKEYPRRAGVSSFGAGGINAHIIVEEYMPASQRTAPSSGAEVIVLSAKDKEALQRYAGELAEQIEYETAAGTSWPGQGEGLSLTPDAVRLEPATVDRYVWAYRALTEFDRLLLVDVFQRMGVFIRAGEAYSIGELTERLGIVPEYRRLFTVLLEMLEAGGFVTLTADQVRTTAQLEWDEVKRSLSDLVGSRDRLVSSFPEAAPYMELIWTCLREYPSVLTGRVNHVDVLFPGGSMERVLSIYRGNHLVDYFNELVAYAVRRMVEQRLAQEPNAVVRVLEIGSGTGGTSSFVLKQLESLYSCVTFSYTDISLGFCLHGKRTFGKQYGFVQFTVLDIEQDPVTQGYAPGSFDIIFASNVIHATRNIGTALDHIRTLLKPDGRVVLNEITHALDFSSLTFGLTSGWWLYEDEEARIPNSPLLSPDQWRQAFEAHGFRHAHAWRIPGDSEFASAQSVIIATGGVQAGQVRKPEFSLRDVAYTLQVGREPMEERAAFVVHDLPGLIAGLRRVAAGGIDPSGIWTGKVGASHADGTADPAHLWQEGRLDQLARYWVSGGRLDWERLRSDVPALRRISLPTYPFRGERYWVPLSARPAETTSAVRLQQALHPFLDRNDSTIEELCFRKAWHSQDPHAAAYRVNGRPVLASSVLLEMARVAGTLAHGGKQVTHIAQIVFDVPALVERQETPLAVSLYPVGDAVEYEIFTERPGGERMIHQQGVISYDLPSGAGRIDLADLQARSEKSELGAVWYEAQAQRGVHIGPAYRALDRMWTSLSAGLARLVAPGETDQALLTTIILEGALQAAHWLIDEGRAFLIPGCIREIAMFEPLTECCYAYVEKQARDCTVWITDDQGEVLAVIQGLEWTPAGEVISPLEQFPVSRI